MDRQMELDERIIILGEDVHRLRVEPTVPPRAYLTNMTAECLELQLARTRLRVLAAEWPWMADFAQ